jgi:hypothetical protein
MANSDEIQQQYVIDLLQNIVERQLADAESDVQLARYLEAQNLAEKYTEEIKLAKGDAKRTKQLKEVTDALAKALPGITEGIHGAVMAFKEGDNISGSAAIMDIFASMAPMLGLLASSLGPVGSAFGMVFSLVSQILGFFGPKSESLGEKLKSALDKFQAEEKEYRITGFRHNVTVYVDSLGKGIDLYQSALKELQDGRKNQVKSLVSATLLSLSGQVTPQVQTAWNDVLSLKPSEDDLAGVINTVYELVISFNPVSMEAFWETATFLKKSDKQGHELWPVVLKVWCDAYTDLMKSTIQLASLLDESSKRLWLDLAPPSQKAHVEKSLSNLWSLGKARLLQYGSANNLQLENLKELRSAVQNRGMLLHIGVVTSPKYSHPVYAGNVIQKGTPARLSDDMARISASQGTGTGQPAYNLVATTGGQKPFYASLPLPYNEARWEPLPSFDLPTDIWALPGGVPTAPRTKDNDQFCFYEAEGSKIAGYVRGKDGKVERFYLDDAGKPIDSVRAVHRPQALVDDPDGKSQSKTDPAVMLPGGALDGTAHIVYGRHWSNAGIRVARISQGASGTDAGWVQGPWGSNPGFGIAVTEHYLWGFAPLGFAFATHASVISALKRGPDQAPRWIYARYPSEITSDHKLYPVITKGLADLSPCDDGTIVASVASGNDVTLKNGEILDATYALYSAAYRIDIGKGTIEVDNFARITGEGFRVHKLPVFCWSEFDSLAKMFEKVGPLLDKPTSVRKPSS